MTFPNGPRSLRRLAVAGILGALAQAAAAHYLWIEREAHGARVYFGEVGEVRERSPGRLDEIPGPRLVDLSRGSAQDQALERRPGSFRTGAAVGAHLAAVEARYKVQDWTRHGLGIVKPVFYARTSPWQVQGEVPSFDALRLDIRPQRGAAGTVQVVFDGKPLPQARLVIYAPNGWQQEHRADAQGRATLPAPWRGQYVVEVIHKEDVRGEFEGQPYEAVRHRATLTLVKPRGIDPAGTGEVAPRVPEH